MPILHWVIDDLTVSMDGNFTFPTALADESNFAVTVLTQPSTPNQSCVVTDGTGTLDGENYQDVTIVCTTETYTVGGSVSGLASGNSVDMQNNLGDDLIVSTDGNFTFPTVLADERGYSVTVLTQLNTPNQTCSVSNSSGVIIGNNITDINVVCSVDEYMIRGSIAGLESGNSVILQNNGIDDLTVNSNGNFVFNSMIADKSSYSISVLNQPTNPNQFCTVTNSSGSVNGDDVVDVEVMCVTETYFVGGLLSGLIAGEQLIGEMNNEQLMLIDNGSFVFPTGQNDGENYTVEIVIEPSSPIQNCFISFGSGTINGQDVIDVEIICDNLDLIYRDGFDLTIN